MRRRRMKKVNFKHVIIGLIFSLPVVAAFIFFASMNYQQLQEVESAKEMILPAEEYDNLIQQLLAIPEIDAWRIKKTNFENYENWELDIHLDNDIQGGMLSYQAETFEELTLSVEKVKL